MYKKFREIASQAIEEAKSNESFLKEILEKE